MMLIGQILTFISMVSFLLLSMSIKIPPLWKYQDGFFITALSTMLPATVIMFADILG